MLLHTFSLLFAFMLVIQVLVIFFDLWINIYIEKKISPLEVWLKYIKVVIQSMELKFESALTWLWNLNP